MYQTKKSRANKTQNKQQQQQQLRLAPTAAQLLALVAVARLKSRHRIVEVR